jgi:hypothetical protein
MKFGRMNSLLLIGSTAFLQRRYWRSGMDGNREPLGLPLHGSNRSIS